MYELMWNKDEVAAYAYVGLREKLSMEMHS